jgi:hypothetical protein
MNSASLDLESFLTDKLISINDDLNNLSFEIKQKQNKLNRLFDRVLDEDKMSIYGSKITEIENDIILLNKKKIQKEEKLVKIKNHLYDEIKNSSLSLELLYENLEFTKQFVNLMFKDISIKNDLITIEFNMNN